MTLASAVGALPPLVRIVGCQCSDPDALETGAFATEMHERVAAAVGGAVDMALELATRLLEDAARGD